MPLLNDNTAFPGTTAPAGIAVGLTAPPAPVAGAFDATVDAVVITGAAAGALSAAPGTSTPKLQFTSSGANVKSPSPFCPVILRPCTRYVPAPGSNVPSALIFSNSGCPASATFTAVCAPFATTSYGYAFAGSPQATITDSG